MGVKKVSVGTMVKKRELNRQHKRKTHVMYLRVVVKYHRSDGDVEIRYRVRRKVTEFVRENLH